MSQSTAISARSIDRFWFVIRQCLHAFHDKRSAAAVQRARSLRKKVDKWPPQQMELFYHSEPFDVACDLAGKSLDLKKHLTCYLQIRDGDASASDEATSASA